MPVLDDALEEGGPAHQVGQVEGEVVVFGEGVEVAEVEVQEVGGGDAADGGHGLDEVGGLSIDHCGLGDGGSVRVRVLGYDGVGCIGHAKAVRAGR